MFVRKSLKNQEKMINEGRLIRSGTKYKFRIPVKGINGMIKNVIAVYQIDAGSEIPRLITNFLEGK